MIPYELTNAERMYFGLIQVEASWSRVQLNDNVTVYFNNNQLVKVLNYRWGYFEYDTEIDTLERKILLPKTSRGKQRKLTVPRILKIKGSGVQFSGSFQVGGIHVYDNKRNMFFIKGFPEDGEIKNYSDITNWIANYIKKQPDSHFSWLDEQLSQKRLKVKISEGDIFAFPIGHGEYGFARVLMDIFTEMKKGESGRSELHMVHARSIIVAPYAFYSDSLEIDIDELVQMKTLPTFYMFDLDVYRREMPIIGNRPLSEHDKAIPLPTNKAIALTMKRTKTDIEAFIKANS